MKKQVVLGLDIGTSSIKATIVDAESGSILKNGRYDYAYMETVPGVVPVKVYEDAVLDIIKAVLKEYTILSLGVSTQMYSLCRDTDSGRMVYQWNSVWSRSEEAEELLKPIVGTSGCPADTIYPSYKLLSMATAARRSFMPYGLKEHIIQYITGTLTTDYTTASASGMFDIKNRRWNRDLLDVLAYSVQSMPAVISHNEIAGFVKKEFTDGADKIAVVPALGDGPSASFACSPISRVCCNLGTSMAVRVISDLKDKTTPASFWTYAYDKFDYMVGGISSNGCSVLNWAKDFGWPDETELAQTEKCMFFPWIYGERTPYWSSDLCGTMTGISMQTDRRSVDAAVIKGIGYSMCRMIDDITPYMPRGAVLAAAGGGVHNKRLLEVLSGTLQVELGILNEYDYLASYGAAGSAADISGIRLKDNIHIERIIKPSGTYRQEYRQWRVMADRMARVYMNKA
jgi:gluconokinase